MMSLLLACLAALSLGLLLWQWWEGARFPLHRRAPDRGFAPPVTLLKPLKGADAETAACLRSWFAQDYAGPVQRLFAVQAEDDPAAAVVRRLQVEFSHADARLVVCPERLGPNSKVSKLAQLEPLTRHDLLVVSDADVAVPPDFLSQLVLPFRGGAGDAPAAVGAGGPSAQSLPPVGLMCALYELATPVTPAMHWEALAVNADFWTSVLQARRLGPLRFALGAVMAVRRDALERLGGFRALVNHLADDYELGRRVAAQGARLELCPVAAACREAPRGWGAVWRHQLRWTRTIRHCQPAPFAWSLLSNPTLWPLLWLAVSPGGASLAGFAVCLAARLAMAAHCQWRLTRRWTHLPWLWLAPVKDLLAAVLWTMAFAGRTVEWRGEGFRVRRGGELQPNA
jgi:ceramide glucosyltransferase